jgi:hypothetical protein
MSINSTNIPVLKQIYNGRSYLDGLANKYILKPILSKGIGGFVFDYESDTQVNLDAEITDHYTEDNTAIQDHIAIRPAKVTLRGFVSELAQAKDTGVSGALSEINSRLETVEAYLGNYTPGMVQGLQKAITATQNAVNTIDQTVNRIENIVGLFTAPGQTKQERAYQELEQLLQTKQIVTLETPYKYFDLMAIESITFIQPDDNRYQSDISVTLKQIRYASVEFTKFNDKIFAGRLAQEAQGKIDAGKTNGTETPTSTLYKIFKPK